jgi:predicted methyltransferase
MERRRGWADEKVDGGGRRSGSRNRTYQTRNVNGDANQLVRQTRECKFDCLLEDLPSVVMTVSEYSRAPVKLH